MIDKKELNKYLKEVRQHLICTKKEKQQIIRTVRDAVITFANENNIHDIDGIYMNFGTPKIVAKQYHSPADYETTKRKLFIRRALITGFSLIMILFAVYISVLLYDHITDGDTMIYITPAVEITSDEFETFQEKSNHEQP